MAGHDSDAGGRAAVVVRSRLSESISYSSFGSLIPDLLAHGALRSRTTERCRCHSAHCPNRPALPTCECKSRGPWWPPARRHLLILALVDLEQLRPENRVHPPELSIELSIFLQNALILFVRETAWAWDYRSAVRSSNLTGDGCRPPRMWNRVRG